jgi:competence protein ComEC
VQKRCLPLFLPFLLVLLLVGTLTGWCQPSPSPRNVVEHPIFRVTYIDVGQGDAILLRTREKTILIDAGSDMNYAAQDFILPYLQQQGIARIDTCVITHPHRDHFGGFPVLVRALPIGEFLVATKVMDPPPGDPETNRTDPIMYKNLITQIQAKGIPIRTVTMKDTFNWGSQVHVDILNTDDVEAQRNPNRPPVNPNDQSLVFKVSAGKIRYLFTGDAEVASEKKMVANVAKKLNATVLKSSHHGSRTASTLPFLQAVDPTSVVISVGITNKYGHPHSTVLERYASLNLKTYRTDFDGTVESITDGKAIEFFCAQTPVTLARRLSNLYSEESIVSPQIGLMRYESILDLAYRQTQADIDAGDTATTFSTLEAAKSLNVPELRRRIQDIMRFKEIHRETAGPSQ